MLHTRYIRGCICVTCTHANELHARAEQSPVALLQQGAREQSGILLSGMEDVSARDQGASCSPASPSAAPSMSLYPPFSAPPLHSNPKFQVFPAQLLIDQTSVCLDNCWRLKEA